MKFVSCLLAGLTLTGLVSAVPTATKGDLASPVKRQTQPSLGLSVYWGQPGILEESLTSVCTQGSYSHVNLAFITDLFGPMGYPKMDMDRRGSTFAQEQSAPGLINGLSAREAIGKCQSRGIKVLISIGGQTGTTKFTSAAYARAAATNVFNVFLGGSNSTTAPLRPFGEMILDGVDIDAENQQPAYWVDFVNALRAKMNADTKKKYIITAAPQCYRGDKAPYGDKSIPDTVLKLMDEVWVQYYNNPSCNHGSTNFLAAVSSWAGKIGSARLWIGAPAAKYSGETGYITPAAIATEVAAVKKKNLKNFGGYMLWKAEAAKTNGQYQKGLRTALNK